MLIAPVEAPADGQRPSFSGAVVADKHRRQKLLYNIYSAEVETHRRTVSGRLLCGAIVADKRRRE
jgi:hypothetical protein